MRTNLPLSIPYTAYAIMLLLGAASGQDPTKAAPIPTGNADHVCLGDAITTGKGMLGSIPAGRIRRNATRALINFKKAHDGIAKPKKNGVPQPRDPGVYKDPWCGFLGAYTTAEEIIGNQQKSTRAILRGVERVFFSKSTLKKNVGPELLAAVCAHEGMRLEHEWTTPWGPGAKPTCDQELKSAQNEKEAYEVQHALMCVSHERCIAALAGLKAALAILKAANPQDPAAIAAMETAVKKKEKVCAAIDAIKKTRKVELVRLCKAIADLKKKKKKK